MGQKSPGFPGLLFEILAADRLRLQGGVLKPDMIRVVDASIKDQILEKAIDLFYQKGYAGASVREIVRAVKVSNSVLYHYFKDKNELLYIIIERTGRHLIESLRKIEEECEDPIEALSQMILTQVSIIREKTKETKIFLEEQYQLKDSYRKKILEQHREIYSIYKRQLERLESQGKLRDVNKTTANFAVHAMMNWFYRWYKESGPLSMEDVARQIIDIFFFGILKT